MSGVDAKFKKILVRNTQQPIPITRVESQNQGNESKQNTEPKYTSEPLSFGLPTINSSKTLVNKMNAVENAKLPKVKSPAEMSPGSRLAVQGKITKQMNFHYDKHIYKNLVPICVKPKQQIIVSRDPLPQRDKEPQLEDFIMRKRLPTYTHTVNIENKQAQLMKEYDGFRVYKMSQNYLL